MKQLLIALLILGVVSTATASIMFTDRSEISGDAMLGISAEMPAVPSVYYLVAVEKAVGLLDDEIVIIQPMVTTYDYPPYGLPGDLSYVGGCIGGGTPINGIVVENIRFTHAGGIGTIDLYESLDSIAWTYVDSINVVPEPMTIGLLGLGGLLVRRRRK